jgi:hypothetical protein
MAQCLLKINRIEEAAKVAREISDCSLASIICIEAAIHNGDLQDAIEIYQSSTKSAKLSPEYHCEVGRIFYENQHYQESIRVLEEGLFLCLDGSDQAMDMVTNIIIIAGTYPGGVDLVEKHISKGILIVNVHYILVPPSNKNIMRILDAGILPFFIEE